MEKLRFEFVVKAGEDAKSNIIGVTSVTNNNNQTFLLPDKFQPVGLHEALLKTPAFLKVKNTLKKRHDKRQVWIAITPEIAKYYMDEDGNMQFGDYLLEESTSETKQKVTSGEFTEETLTRILERISEMKGDTGKQDSIKGLLGKFVIEKSNKKTSSASQWMAIFEGECTRLEINEDIKKIEALKLFLDDSCTDWYSSMLIKHTIRSEWCMWKKSFCDTYADKGWTPIRYAITFKYRQGSLLDYALKKERLMLEINRSIDIPTLIDLIATGLPNYIADKIDREDMKETEDLFNSIRGLEHLANNKILERKTKTLGKTTTEINGRYQPCSISEKENRGSRYHPEVMCWFKNKNGGKPNRDQIRHVNNSEFIIFK